MLNSLKRTLSGLMAAAMVLTALPTLALAEESPAANPTEKPCAHVSSYVLQSDSHEATDTTGGLRHYKCSQCGEEYAYETDPMVYEVNPKTGEPISFDYTANPYLPNYEFMPDNELHVFWSNADDEWRVYAVGSHDTKLSGWCGPDITCWSAPVYDLSDWRFEAILRDTGLFFACDFNYDLQTDQAILYAFPFFGNPEMSGTHLWVNGNNVPDSEFDIPLNPEGVTGLDKVNLFDPAIYIAEDGTILTTADNTTGGTKHCQLAKVNADRTATEWVVDVKMAEGERNTNGFNPKHYEGSTIDRVDVDGHWFWVIQYSYKSNWDAEDVEKDVDGENRWWPLVYIYSDPDMSIDELEKFTGWHWGGIIGDNGGFFRQDPGSDQVTEHPDPTYCWGNNHGGLVYINGNWYVSNHRHTSDNAGRQGFLQEISISYTDGKLVMNTPEYTSSMSSSINAYHTWPAYIACHLLPTAFSETHEQTLYIDTPLRGAPADYWDFIYTNPEYAAHRSPITGITNAAEVGFKYLNFGEEETAVDLTVLVSRLSDYVDGTLKVFLDAPSEEKGGTMIGSIAVTKSAMDAAGVSATSSDGLSWSELSATMNQPVQGVHGVYFVFSSEEAGNICKLDEFTFHQSLTVETQPADFAGVVGATASFQVAANRENVSYQWFYSRNGMSWSKSTMPGSTTDTLSVEMTKARVGQQYKCVITDADGFTVESQAAALTVAAPTAKIVTNPVNQTGSVGKTATFAVVAEGEGLTYQWMYSKDGSYWSKSTADGSNTATMTIDYKAFRNGQMYKCVVTEANGAAVESTVATMTVAR